MRSTGTLKSVSYSIDHKLLVTFEIEEDDIEQLNAIQNDLLVIEAKKYRKKRSRDANAYFWKLADMIARAINSDKWSVYLWLLSKYGVFVDIAVISAAVEEIKEKMQHDFRYIETLEEGNLTTLRCYYGTHTYNSKEMAHLITMTQEEAKALNIETLTPRELEDMLNAWKG